MGYIIAASVDGTLFSGSVDLILVSMKTGADEITLLTESGCKDHIADTVNSTGGEIISQRDVRSCAHRSCGGRGCGGHGCGLSAASLVVVECGIDRERLGSS